MDIKDTFDMSDIWDKTVESGTLGTAMVKLPEIGTYVFYQDKEHEILSTVTYQERMGDKVVFSTFATILEVTDEGDDAGKPTKYVNSSQIRLI